MAGTGAITGNTTVGGTLGVTGATTLSSTLAVTGSATFSTNLVLNGSTSGSTTIVSAATASGTLTLPSATDQLVARATTDTLTNKTMSGASNTFTNIPNSALSNNTISGVALGGTLATLTLNTSGTGLSGSTTYNGSGAATFTVTSNATSANTASTIVARDASGNFSAGTITAALSGNSSTATTLQTARNITINLGSNSAASFNGSSDITPGVTGTLAIGNGGTGATTAQGARTNLLPAQSAGQAGYVLTTNGTDVSWSYLGNAMVTTFNGRANAVTLTSGDVTTALGYSPSTYYAKYLQGADAYTNGSDGWWRSNGNCGWYNASYAVGWYATQSGWVQTYNSAGVLANAFQQVSDVRLKDNITDSKYGLDTVLKLRSVQYDMKSNGKHEVGLIAQEVEEVIPEFVFTSADEEGTKSVNYAQMVSVLIKAVQELSAEVEQLKAKIKE